MRFAVTILFALIALSAGAARSQTVLYANDSLSVPLQLFDSVGNRVEFDTTTKDWGYVVVYDPGKATAAIFTDSFMVKNASADVKIEAASYAAFQKIIYRNKAATLTASSSVGRLMSYEIMLRDSSLKLWNPIRGQFYYLPTNAVFYAELDSLNRVQRRIDTTMSWALQNYINVSKWNGSAVAATNVAGVPVVDVVDWRGSTPNVLQSGRVDGYVGAMAADVLTSSALASSATLKIRDSLQSGLYFRGSVDASARADSTFTSSSLTQVTDHWKNALIVFYTGSLRGQSATIKKATLLTSKDSLSVYPKFTVAPASGDSFSVIPLGGGIYPAVAKGINDSTASLTSLAKANRDTILQTKLDTYSDAGVAGSFFDSSLLWARTGIATDSNLIYRSAGRAIHDSTASQTSLVQAVWNEDTTGNGSANSTGLLLQKAGGGAASSNWTNTQRDSVLAALGDNSAANKIWKADTTGRTGGANSFGNLLRVSGDSSIWAKPIDLWNLPFSSGFTSGSMGDSLRKPSYVGNLSAVAGHTASATNLRSMLDGSGGHTLYADLHGSVDTVLKGVNGSGGGNDSASIARWVWNTPQSHHLSDGTFGRFLDVEISSMAAGSGAWSFTVVAYDTASHQAVPNAIVSIRNTEQTALVAVGTSNSYGRAWFNLNSGTYLAIIISPGYRFPAYDTIVVTGPGADTVRGYQFIPGAPASPSLCRVYGYLYGANGLPERDASVTASLPKGVMRTGTLVVSPFGVKTATDSAGYFYLDLIPSDSLLPSGSSYEITISRSDGAILRKRMPIPAQASWRLIW